MRYGWQDQASRRRLLQIALLAIPVIAFGFQAWAHRWTFEDGFINLRIVRQIEAGHGPVFNVGERVEAYTSAAWIAVLTVGDLLLPIRLEWIAVVLGIAASAAGLALAMAGAARLVRRTEPDAFLVPAGALVPLAVLPMWYFATSGLEGGITFLWLGAVLFLLAGWARTHEALPIPAAVVLGLGWLVRPELVIFSILGLVAVLVAEREGATWSRRLLVVAAVFAVPVAYQVFRMGYFATLVPNTAIAKEASGARWHRGWRYLTDFVDTYALWVPLLLLAAAAYVPLLARLRRSGERRSVLTVAVFVVGAIAQTAYIVRVGGDYLPARLLLPALFAFIAPVAVIRLRARGVGVLALAVWAVVCGVALRSSERYVATLGLDRQHVVTLADAGFQRSDLSWFHGEGVYYRYHRLPARPGPDARPPTVAEPAIGMIGYAVGPEVQVFDTLGLADPITARFRLSRPGFPGHEKPLPPPWAAARLTAPGSPVTAVEFAQPTLFIRPLTPLTTGAAFARQVAAARQALGCPTLVHLEASYRAPLSPGRFVANIFRSFDNTRLRIPPDPAAAVREECPGG